VQTEELFWDDEPEPPRAPYVDGAWGRTANPNTVDGELQNIAAFGAGLTRLSGRRRAAAKAVVWLILIGLGLSILIGVLGIVGVW
jgi:uncharacterized membrane protein